MSYLEGDEAKIRLKLLDYAKLFSKHTKDQCLYKEGRRISCPDGRHGTEATWLLGETYSGFPGITQLQFYKHFGVFIYTNPDHPDFTKRLELLARALTARSRAYAQVLADTSP